MFVIGHRGYPSVYPENTLRSFQETLNLDIDIVELDVHLTKDRQVVVFHDCTLERTSNGKGYIHEYTLEELKKLDVGSWKATLFANERISTLAEIFSLDWKNTKINIEIKKEVFSKLDEFKEDRIEKQVVDLAIQYGLFEQIIVSSFEDQFLERIQKLPEIPKLGLLEKGLSCSKILELCLKYKIYSYHPSKKELHKMSFQQLQQNGIFIFPYTLNTIEDWKLAQKLGVDGVMTDDICGFKKFLT
ncbi:MAG: glycerophosphoryl diester phosphodiesterase [bacterium]|jgi:glycerophosphoryl diester phosphodiesterase